jgi:hypothetical protein
MSRKNLTRVQIRSSFEPKTRLPKQLWQVGNLQASRGVIRRVNVLVPPLRSSRQVVEVSRHITLILVRQGPFIELFSKPIRQPTTEDTGEYAPSPARMPVAVESLLEVASGSPDGKQQSLRFLAQNEGKDITYIIHIHMFPIEERMSSWGSC